MVDRDVATKEWTSELRTAGLRVTAGRLAVLDALDALDGQHPDVEEIVSVVRRRLGSVSVQAVYNALDALRQAGLVRRIEPAGSPARFETRAGDNHHHIVCRSCGAAVDIDCVVGAAPCLSPDHAAGFAIDEAEVTFWGLCPSCQPASRRRTTRSPQLFKRSRR